MDYHRGLLCCSTGCSEEESVRSSNTVRGTGLRKRPKTYCCKQELDQHVASPKVNIKVLPKSLHSLRVFQNTRVSTGHRTHPIHNETWMAISIRMRNALVHQPIIHLSCMIQISEVPSQRAPRPYLWQGEI